MKKLSILGSTGSIGKSALDVVQRLPDVEITALAAGSDDKLLERQVRQFKPAIAALYDKAAAKRLCVALADTPVKVYSGREGIIHAAAESGADTLLNAAVGVAGLAPTKAAIEAGLNIALANKETLVAAGDFIMPLAKKYNCALIPVDSEHNALWQLLAHSEPPTRVTLTASGGAFYGKTSAELEKVTPADALQHPTWSMGDKITIDCATMVNKALEVIEARHLFGIAIDDIDVLIHRQSIVHAMAEFADGSVTAMLSNPDMRLPIQYALTYPKRLRTPTPRLNLAEIGTLTFTQPDYKAYPCLTLLTECGKRGGAAPAVATIANDNAVYAFLQGKIAFPAIYQVISKAVEHFEQLRLNNIDEIISLETEIGIYSQQVILDIRS